MYENGFIFCYKEFLIKMDSDNDSEFYSPVPDRRKPNQVFKKNSNELKFVAY